MAPNHDIATRALVVALKSPSGGKTTLEVVAITGVSKPIVNKIYARAIERGFDPNATPLILKDEYLEDAPRSGRPTKQTSEVKQSISQSVRHDRYGREKTCADLAGELSQGIIDISPTTIYRCLKSLGFKKTKPTRKPGLTN
jgi:transposase